MTLAARIERAHSYRARSASKTGHQGPPPPHPFLLNSIPPCATIPRMGVSTTAKRGHARGASPPSSHVPHEVIGVVLITVSLLILLGLLSYAPSDRTFFASASPSITPSPTRNMIGTAGASLASGLFWLIGTAAYLLPALLTVIGGRCFVHGALQVTLRSAAGSAVVLLFLSGLLHLELTGIPTISSGMVQKGMAGGAIGQLLADNLRSSFASTGAHILILSGLLVSLLLATPVSLTDLWRRLPEWWISVSETVAALLPERAAPSEKVKQVKPKPVRINRTSLPDSIEQDHAAPEIVSAPLMAAAPKAASAPANELDDDMDMVVSKSVPAGYLLPDARELLSEVPGPSERMTDEMLKAQAGVLARALLSFGIEGKVTEIHPGPVITMYEFEPAPGVKVSRIVNLSDDLALALKAASIRIVAPLPGKSVVGVEVPNLYRETVSLKEVLTSDAYTHSRSKLTLALGKDIFGKSVTADLKTMPHLLVAGATGAGKSVGLNTMLLSMLTKAKPDEVKLLLIDPKMLELQTYDGIPHLLRPVITDAKSANRGLGWVVQEMERRYKLLADAGVRNVDSYNRRVAEVQGLGQAGKQRSSKPEQTELPIEFLSDEERLSAGEATVAATESRPAPSTPPSPLPYIVVMIDELADLMMVAPKDVEDKIARLAQMARAAGIHLILATQRPSVDVLTGLIKANFPARISFQVSSKTDSRTILDANGAEALLGRGDMLYLASGTGRLTRLHGSFVPDEDVRRVVEFVKKQATPTYSEELQSISQEDTSEEQAKDEVYEQAKDLVLTSGQASASLIQRRLRVGYPRAARMIERMEEEGLVSAPSRDGRREVIGRKGPVGEVEE
jgi:DNA segregation ATPase FtsK/SpoIIIE, S-DNA-T family